MHFCLILKDDMPFDNLKNTRTKKLNPVLLTLFTFLCLMFAIFVPFFGMAGAIFLPVPVTLLVISKRIRDGIICAVIACTVLIFLDYVMALAAALLIIGISFIYKSFISKNKSKLFIVSCIFLAFFGALALYLLITSVISGVNYVNEVIGDYNTYVDNTLQSEYVEVYGGLLAIEQSQLEVLLAQTAEILKFIIYIIPGILISTVAFMSFMNYKATAAVLERYNISIKKFAPFKNWDIPWYWCWGVITGLILVLIPYGNQNLNKILDIAGFNILAIFGPLYVILGISVIWGLMEKFKISFIWRITIFIILGLFLGFTVFILPFIGLIDIWVNFRRLKRS